MELLWNTHSAAQKHEAFSNPVAYAFKNELLLTDYDVMIPALVGMLFVLWRRLWELLFPVALLVTVFLIHQFHRPYWYYYYLHFAIPMAWLAAIGLKELFVLICRCEFCEFKKPPFKPVWALLL